MKNKHNEKHNQITILIFFLVIILSNITQINSINNATFDQNSMDTTKLKEKKMLSNEIMSQNAPIFKKSDLEYTSLPNSNFIDNSNKITELEDYILNQNLIYDRPNSIMATFYAYQLIKSIDPILFLERSNLLESFLLSKYNNDTHHFEDLFNYELEFQDGKELFMTPYTPEISHQMALILLAQINRLHVNFNSYMIIEWETEILSNLNPDGGFGVIFSPISTLMETYYAVFAVKALNNFQVSAFSPIKRANLQEFVESRQRTDTFIGIFNEYDDSPFFGWEFYYSSWLALKIIEQIDGNYTNIRELFIDFVKNNEIYNSQTNCFYSSWNDKLTPQTSTFFGTAIICECIRLIGADGDFPEKSIALTVLLNSTVYNQTGNFDGPNYFFKTSESIGSGDDLFIQYLILDCLKNHELLGDLDDENDNLDSLINYYKGYLTSDGGGCYITSYDICAYGDFIKYKYFSSNENSRSKIDLVQLFQRIMSRKTTNGYFSDYINYTDSLQFPSSKNLVLLNEWDYYPIATNFFSLDILDRYNLMDFFSENISFNEYLDFEQWIADNLLSEGYFSNNSKVGYLTGNLESTFYALKSQEILISYNDGQSFLNYYSPENISLILDYANQFINHTDDLWYSLEGTNENSGLDEFEMSKYIYVINTIFNSSFITSINEKLNNYIKESLSKIIFLSDIEQIHLLELINLLGTELSIAESSYFQNKFLGYSNDILETNYMHYSKISLINQIQMNKYKCVLIDLPINQNFGEVYNYQIQIISLASVIYPENLELHGISEIYSNWYLIGNIYQCDIIPEINITNPYQWTPSLTFNYEVETYGAVISLDFEFLWESYWVVNDNEGVYWFSYHINSNSELCKIINPEILLHDNEMNVIKSYNLSNMAVQNLENGIIYTGIITSYVVLGELYKLVADFNYTWYNRSEIEFGFAVPPDISNPVLNSPVDFSYIINNFGNNVSWDIYDEFPSYYKFFIDAVENSSGYWEIGEISFNIDNLHPGSHNLTLWVNDTSNNYNQDTVQVEIFDLFKPDIDSPDDIEYYEGNLNNYVIWNIYDDYPGYYWILTDYSVIEYNSWNNGYLNINFDNLDIGVHTVTILVNDTSGNLNQDTIIISVLDPANSTILENNTSSGNDFDINKKIKSQSVVNSLIYFSCAFFSMGTTILIQYKKRQE